MTTAVIGVQWGDEGKGKIVDLLAPNFDICCRDQGGDNAGHTVVVGGHKTVLHLITSGILSSRTRSVLGCGVKINPNSLDYEIEELRSKGIPINRARLLVSDRAHLILPYHIARDCASEIGEGIGTTLKGIGPAYEDEVGRRGIRVCDVLQWSNSALERKIEEYCQRADNLIHYVNKVSYRSLVAFEKERKKMLRDSLEPYLEPDHNPPLAEKKQILNHAAIIEMLRRHKPLLQEHACDTATYLQDQKSVLHEAAQGALLDINMGTYPMVTSSCTGYGGLLTGSGTATRFDRVIGVVKAYSTRVGGGTMPTELKDAIGDYLQSCGNEVGATTGRKRRCGWLDLVAVKHGLRIAGATELALTKLDILDGLAEIQICTGYTLDGTDVSFPPMNDQLERVVPQYKTFEGWKKPIGEIRRREDLPKEAQAYLSFIEQETKLPIRIIGVGEDRDATILAPSEISYGALRDGR